MKRISCGAIVLMAVAGTGMAMGADGPPTVKAGDAAADKPALKLVMGESAPEIEAVTVGGKAVKLADFVGKPVVLQFGSISEPVFRMRVADVEKLAAKYGDKVMFLVVYARESHPADTEAAIEVNAQTGFGVTKPVNEEERVKLAKLAIERLGIKNQQVVVDAWSNASSLRYGDFPNMTYVIDGKGFLQAGYAWMDPAKVTGAVDALLAGKAVPPEFRGRTQPGSPGQPDLGAAAKEMGGRLGGNGIATVLDNLKLTEKQKEAVYPALTDYLAKGRDYREKFAIGTTPEKEGSAKATPGDTMKSVSAEDAKKALEGLKTAAVKLKEVVKKNLSEADAKQVMDVLDRGPAHRLFAD